MRTAYKIVAHTIAAAVVFQAAVVVWSMFEAIGVMTDGGTLSAPPLGAMIHGTVGVIVVPLLAIVLVVIALLAHAGLKWALYTLLAVLVQVGLAFAAFGASWVGMLHAVNAFGIIALAEVAAYAVAHAEVRVPTARPVARPAM